MIIVAGWLRVAATDRQQYLDGCRTVVEAARATDGCLDFHLSPDIVDPERINVFERWASAESVERFRGDGPESDQQAMIADARVDQYEIVDATPLT